MKITRLDAEPHLPFPRAVRVGDYVYTSSIYPIGDDGRLIEALARRGRPLAGRHADASLPVRPERNAARTRLVA
jgi:hypothetical protein